AATLADLDEDVGAAGERPGPVALRGEQGDRLGDGLGGGVVNLFQGGFSPTSPNASEGWTACPSLALRASLPVDLSLIAQLSRNRNHPSFVSRSASTPWCPSSRPRPLSFMPPNGHCGVAGTGSLMPMMPASSPSAIRHATVRSFVNTYAARPYFVLFAWAITSSSLLKSSSGITGANGSSVRIRESA